MKYKSIFAKGYIPNQSEEVLLIKKFKNIAKWAYVIGDLMVKTLLKLFMKKNFQNKLKKD